MKRTFAVFGAVVIFAACLSSHADIIAGPITNPANGHDYYLLTPLTWPIAEAEAEDLGGTLAIIKNDAEQEWVFSEFGPFGGSQRNLWIGLHRENPGGPFSWVDGTPLDYAHWYAGEPNNMGGNETCVHMRWDPAAPGTWNDVGEGTMLNAVVEVAKPRKASLTSSEKALIGNWYESGRGDRPCYIAGTETSLIALNASNGSGCRAILTRQGFLSAPAWQVHGEVVSDRILWSNGTWWSRKAMDYNSASRPKTAHEPTPDQ